MIRSLHLNHFKGFERFRVRLRGDAFFVGPNNAGKSTLIAALRAVAYMRRIAVRRRADIRRRDREAIVPAYPFRGDDIRLVEENIKFEFRANEETRLEARFSNGTTCFAIWPAAIADDESPFFYVREKDGTLVDRPAKAAAALPEIGVIPVLTPIDQEETRLTEKHVRANLDSRLASRHCRNQVRLLKVGDDDNGVSRFADFKTFIEPWLPEMRLVDLKESYAAGGPYLDLYYTEGGSTREKELFWAGDGMQVWLQLLLHAFRLQRVDTLILDEPEVFLHPDLQRRLVRLLQELPPQAITATHSPELVTAASPNAVVWVARHRDRAVNAPDQNTLAELSRAVGTQFNLKLARALRTRVALFVEGNDMEIVRNLAATLELRHVATEAGIAVIPLEGFTNWENVEPFRWLTRELLEDSVTTVVVLDRDYRTKTASDAVCRRLGSLGIVAHVWERKELESYLLHVPTIAEASGASKALVGRTLEEAATAAEHKVEARLLDEVLKEHVSDRQHRVSVTERFGKEFEALWADETRRLALVPPEDLFGALNRQLQNRGFSTVAPRALSRKIPADGIPDEMRDLLKRVEALAEEQTALAAA